MGRSGISAASSLSMLQHSIIATAFCTRAASSIPRQNTRPLVTPPLRQTSSRDKSRCARSIQRHWIYASSWIKKLVRPYATLSHTWEHDEGTYQDMKRLTEPPQAKGRLPRDRAFCATGQERRLWVGPISVSISAALSKQQLGVIRSHQLHVPLVP